MRKLIISFVCLPLIVNASEINDKLLYEQNINAFNIGLQIGDICQAKSSNALLVLQSKIVGMKKEEAAFKFKELQLDNIIIDIYNHNYSPSELSSLVYKKCISDYKPIIEEKLNN